MLEYLSRRYVMRRAILFLVFALFLAMVIQPNLNKQIKEKTKNDVPEQTKSVVRQL